MSKEFSTDHLPRCATTMLSSRAYHALGYLYGHHNKKHGYAYPSYEVITAETGMSNEQWKAAVDEAAAKGFIKTEENLRRNDGTFLSMVYRIQFDAIGKMNRDFRYGNAKKASQQATQSQVSEAD